MEAVEHQSGTIESCVAQMNNGEIMFIFPGGTKEMVFSDNRYEIVWKENAGFAKVAVEAKVVN